MAYVGNEPTSNFASVTKDSFSGDGSTTAFTLSKASPTNGVAVFVENVRQEPTTAYAVSGTTLTFTAAPVSASGNNIYVLHHNAPASTAIHSAAQPLTATSGTFSAGVSGTTGTFTSDVSIDGGSFVFNESSADKDFRVESNGNANMLVVDGGEDMVFIGKSAVHSFDAYGNEIMMQLESTGTAPYAGFGMVQTSNDATPPVLAFGKSRGTSAGAVTIVQDGDSLGRIEFQGMDGSDLETGASIIAEVDGTPGANDMPGRLLFYTTADGAHSATERMRITKLGYTKMSYNVATTGTGSGAYHEIIGNENSYVMVGKNVSSSGNTYWGLIRHTTAPDDNSSSFLYMDDGGGATGRCAIYSDGDVKNHDNSYGSISDERIKQDIRDSNSQWDDIKAVKVRNFKKKDDVRQYGADKAWEQIGVVAQELETVSPKLIRNVDPSVCDIESSSEFGTLEDDTDNPVYYVDGDTIPSGKKVGDVKEYRKKVKEIKAKVKGVNYSILYMKAIKALQEAMTRIETLEAKVKTLEDA